MELFDLEQDTDWKSNIADLQRRTGLDLTWLYRVNYKKVSTTEQLHELAEELKAATYIAVDTETTGLLYLDKTVSVQFTTKAGTAYFVPLRMSTMTNLDIRDFVDELKPILEDKSKYIIAFNAKFDAQKLRCLLAQGVGIDIFKANIIDLQILNKLKDPDAPLSLKSLTKSKLNLQQIELNMLFTTRKKAAIVFESLPSVDAIPYAGADTDMTFRIFEKDKEQYLDKIQNDKIVVLEHRVQRIIADMEANGLYIDTSVLAEARNECLAEMQELSKKIKEKAGQNFNINSPKDLADFAYNKLKLVPLAFTEKGAPSTGKEGFGPYRETNEYIDMIMSYKEADKLLKAFIDKIPTFCDANSRVHPNFNPMGAASGRFTCTDPNFQQLPKQRGSSLGFRSAIRKSIKPAEGYILWDADYSQVEYRLFASMCGDQDLRQAYLDGLDFHKFSASMAFNVPYDNVTKLQRLKAKSVSFGILYGISAVGLAQQCGCSQAEAEQMLENYFNRFPRVKEWIEEVQAEAERKKYVKTIFGRRRILKDLFSKNRSEYKAGLRKSVNSRVQGSAADILKMAFVRLDNVIKEKGYDARLISTVHDEIVAEISLKEDILQVSKDFEEAMNMQIQDFVPIVCEPAMGFDWSSLIEIPDFDITKIDEYKEASNKHIESTSKQEFKEEVKSVDEVTISLPEKFSKVSFAIFKQLLTSHPGEDEFIIRVGQGEGKKANSKIALSADLIQEFEKLGIDVKLPEAVAFRL